MKKLMQKINKYKHKINPLYVMRMSDFEQIYRGSHGLVEMIYNAFAFGYMQGMNAAKAEMRKAARS